MCTYSMVGDDFTRRIQTDEYWKKVIVPGSPGQIPTTSPDTDSISNFKVNLGLATAAEVAALRREIEHLKELLKRAIEYDKKNNEPHCETDEKIAAIKVIAKALGVDLSSLTEA